MGRHKLLLELGGRPVITRLIDALTTAGCDAVWIVLRRDDEDLRRVLTGRPVRQVLVDAATPDMRSTVRLGLAAIAAEEHPQPHDGWLLCPADHPVLSSDVVRAVIERGRGQPEAIIVPTHLGRRGHPTLFPWSLAERVAGIPADQGVNWLLRHAGNPIAECPADDPTLLLDLDTPDDWEQLKQRFE